MCRDNALTAALGGAGAETVHAFPSSASCSSEHWRAQWVDEPASDPQWIDEPASDKLWVTARDGDVVLITTGDGTFTRE